MTFGDDFWCHLEVVGRVRRGWLPPGGIQVRNVLQLVAQLPILTCSDELSGDQEHVGTLMLIDAMHNHMFVHLTN